jgi:hypothetical protein
MTTPWTQTYSGRKLYALHPEMNDPQIEDIQHALAQIPRWGGHARMFGGEPWTVAMHSVLVAMLAARKDSRHHIIKAALLHDAHEAYIGDIATPYGDRVTLDTGTEVITLRELKRRWDEVIFDKFIVSRSFAIQAWVAECDAMALWIEGHILTANVDGWLPPKPRNLAFYESLMHEASYMTKMNEWTWYEFALEEFFK